MCFEMVLCTSALGWIPLYLFWYYCLVNKTRFEKDCSFKSSLDKSESCANCFLMERFLVGGFSFWLYSLLPCLEREMLVASLDSRHPAYRQVINSYFLQNVARATFSGCCGSWKVCVAACSRCTGVQCVNHTVSTAVMYRAWNKWLKGRPPRWSKC